MPYRCTALEVKKEEVSARVCCATRVTRGEFFLTQPLRFDARLIPYQSSTSHSQPHQQA